MSIRLTPTGAGWLWGFGLLLMFSGPIIVYLLGWIATAQMQHGVLKHQQSLLGLVWHTTREIPVEEIQAFETEVRRSGFIAWMVVVIRKKVGVEDLRLGDMSGDEKELLVEQMNQALANKTEFRYSSSVGKAVGGGLAFGGFILLAGLVCLYFLQTSHIQADRAAGKIHVYKRRWLFPWPGQHAQSMAIADFNHVASSEFSVERSTSSRNVWLEARDGRTVPLAYGPMFTDDSAEYVSAVITNWVKRSSKKNRHAARRAEARKQIDPNTRSRD